MSEFIKWCEKYCWYLLIAGILTVVIYIGIVLIVFAVIGFVNKYSSGTTDNLSQAYKTGLIQKFGKLTKCPVCNKKIDFIDSNYLCSSCNSKLEFKQNDGFVDYYKLIIVDKSYNSEYEGQVLPIYDWCLLVEHKIKSNEYLENRFKKKDYFELNILNLNDLGVAVDSKEKIYFFEENASVREARAIRNYVGGSVRVAKGVRINAGQAESHDEIRQLDTGRFAITNKRLIFTGGLRNYSLPINKIIGVSEYSDGITVSSSNRQKSQTFIIHSPNLAKIIINSQIINKE